MNLVQNHPEIFIYLSTLFISIYYVMIKKFKQHMMILYFWLHALSYFAFSLIFLFQERLVPQALQQLAMDTSYHNSPLYLLSAVSLVGTYIILDKLIKVYPVATILALSQISIVLSTVGYIALGDKVSFISLVGIGILFMGAMISGLEKFNIKHPLKSFESYDKKLLYLSIIKALLYTATLLITYLCTAKYSDVTKHILHLLTKHLHFIPFVAIAPIHFNIGVQFANFVLMFLFITYILKEKNLIFKTMVKEYPLILQLSALYILNAYYYYKAFDLIEDKNYITAISKIYLPLTLILSCWVYHQKPSKEQVVGMAIIIVGSFITTFG